MERNDFHSGLPGAPRPALRCTGLTVLELLVVIAITAIVLALLLPAVMHARESARVTICTSHLREIGLAIHDHHLRQRRLPAAWVPAREDVHFAYGWVSGLLPEIEQSGLYQRLSPLVRPPDLATNSEAERYSLPLLLCPSDLIDKSFPLAADAHHFASSPNAGEALHSPSLSALAFLPATNYVGVYGTVEADDYLEHQTLEGQSFGDGSVIDSQRVAFADLQRGLSQTLLVGERTMAMVPSTWLGVDLRGEDAPCRLVGSAITAPNCETCDECEFSSRHASGSNFLWADGHVTLVNESINTTIYRESARRLLIQGAIK